MNEITLKAKDILQKNDLTCVIIKGEDRYISHKRGVDPLLDLISGKQDCTGGYVADKVVGKAVALLYVLLKVREIYAITISEPALEVLKSSDIKVEFENLVPAIKNRTNTGNCPMESAVLHTDNPAEALKIILTKKEELFKNKK